MPGTPRRRPRDINQLAYATMLQATGQVPPEAPAEAPPKNPAAVARGKLGGSKGGTARAAALTKRRRSEIARKAARARWAGTKGR